MENYRLHKADDPEMAAAFIRARETLSEFWAVHRAQKPGQANFSVKVRFEDANGCEYFWLDPFERADGQVAGKINAEPRIVSCVERGQRASAPEADIVDWTYSVAGKLLGNFTLRVILKTMPAEQAAAYWELFAE
jgi:uncharacterized protein YegJ (DUF2314 family)